MKDSASFWTDIKTLEERLAKSPDSFCFAQLADVYLKVGLVDDALHIARQGVKKHPGYLSGQRALSLSCHAKGLNDEALAALKLVVKAMPEDISSQKLLGRLLADAGDQNAACQAFKTVLEFAPDDVECRLELESLERSAGGMNSTCESDEDDEEIIEDLEIVEDLDAIEDESTELGDYSQDYFAESAGLAASHHDPLSTGTLAELYVKQGFIHKALEIYRAILADNPLDRVTAERVADLEALDAGSSPIIQETAYIDVSEGSDLSEFESQQVSERGPSSVPLQGVADNAISALDGWLENIRRIKSCR
ncbi:MAG: tetratricopeptide repeat protein [Geobacteraceae bacterium]|nr:tetratricopeptide repeat protein [Geobacteraceae bacterium]NTW79467.1 tetratricopeptide repeat protein [Geobacteraceae bacterium]